MSAQCTDASSATRSQFPHLPRSQRAETLGRDSCCLKGFGERTERRVDCFISQLECAVVVSERKLRATIDQRPYCLGRVHVVVAHEPPGLVGTDRQDGKPKRPITFASTAEISSVAVPRISHEVNASTGRLDHK